MTNDYNQPDSVFIQQVQKLYKLTLYGRWLFVGCLWLTIGSLCLWDLRAEIALWKQYFTWVALRYGLLFHPLSTFGLSFCIAITIAVATWQIRNMTMGLPVEEKQRLENQVYRIRRQGPTHPLWKWVCH
ncbi:MAG TPA: hypothetical protein VK184_21315 [Nostocaceae cyanobacterium]|nr:hypothetical protein [Nostocaceae cyanobacterium]